MKTLYLFTASDLKTTILPSVAFALFTSVDVCQRPLHHQLARVPSALFWAWLNTLAFAINNQRHDSAIEEDRLNKSWRPIPAGRITRANADTLGTIIYPITIAAASRSGGWSASIFLAMLGYIYNDLAYGSQHWLIRNILNGFGLVSFCAGTFAAMTGHPLTPGLIVWLAMIFALVCTTIHGQDMYDQEGDRAEGRSTVPLVFGDAFGRWSLAFSIGFWAVVAPYWWRSSLGIAMLSTLGIYISCRWITKRNVQDDRRTFTIYTIWVGLIYCLPLMRNL